MTDNRQTDNIEDELLSAYVDGELTDQQLALIEQRLTADPRAAQLVEELRAISRELQALPTEVVGEDLRATIRQRAERAMLLGTAAQTAVAEREQGRAARLGLGRSGFGRDAALGGLLAHGAASRAAAGQCKADGWQKSRSTANGSGRRC